MEQAITIDKARSRRVETGLTVMGTSGVVGQVYSAGEHTAEVRLLTDPIPHRGALESSRAEGVVRGSLEACCIGEPRCRRGGQSWRRGGRRVWAAATRPASSSAPS
ncbi:MAG: rod shape-determining protein MreC [Adlercreutzia sp.]